MAGFDIYSLPVAGGVAALCPLPGRQDDYSADLQRLCDWRPSLVISMTTQAEMVACDAAGLGDDIEALAACWIHLPVADFGVPTPDIEELWRVAADTALATLQRGGRVLIHCNGGCGRSGMAVLRLMVEAGEEPEAALARLRAIRPCAVETEAQMRWAFSGRD
ncbi:protein-tyrosine phosphatase family protein [Roseovarius aestuarii]|uniref:Dual specificity phosphatase, catalytic domain n=1 Tax=Roseovarius aestuarii TaxID=475083 RepID=A0A1X7BU36_9RHOB|nr:protein-tyrosine phosphatase family protein [Roseovarius aestuarii]SMC13147.1 Dual specificity phosphatase, catalytic domain [Roseovarius aestuarii]